VAQNAALALSQIYDEWFVGDSRQLDNAALLDPVRLPILVELTLLYARAQLEGGEEPRSALFKSRDPIQRGIEAFEKIEKLLNTQDPRSAAEALLIRGRLENARRLSDPTENIFLQRALEKFNQAHQIATINVLSRSLDPNPANQGVAAKLLQNREKALQLARDTGDPVLQIRALREFAEHYINFNSTKADLRPDWDLVQSIRIRDTDQRLPDGAIKPLQIAKLSSDKARAIADDIGDKAQSLYCRVTQSWVRHHQGEYTHQLGKERASIRDDARSRRHSTLEAEATTDLAHFNSFFVDKHIEAGRDIRDALEFRRKLGHHRVQDAEHLTEYLFRRGQLNECIQNLEEISNGVDAHRRIRAKSQIALANVLLGKYGEAERQLTNIEGERRRLTETQSQNTQLRDGGQKQERRFNLRQFRIGGSQFSNPWLMLVYAHLHNQQQIAERRSRSVPKRNPAELAAKAGAEASAIEREIQPSAERGLFWTYSDHPTALAGTYLLLNDLQRAQQWIKKAASWWNVIQVDFGVNLESLVMFWEHKFLRAEILFRTDPNHAKPLLESCAHVFEKSGHRLLQPSQELLQKLVKTAA
jgi:hypothetical protein